MTDRRRINGPPSGTAPPVFLTDGFPHLCQRPQRTRKANELRRIFLKTGLVPAASGSAYLELEVPASGPKSLVPISSTVKLSCTVHGPKPVSRNSSFSPNLQLTASVKFAPFATRLRRGYIRDATERDLGTHLETALKGCVILDKWPKGGVDVIVTVLEGDEDQWWKTWQDGASNGQGVGLMNVLAGCITVASAALADARIDCLDLLAGGVAAVVPQTGSEVQRILDPCPVEHEDLRSAVIVGYMPARDEITQLWFRGGLEGSPELNLTEVEHLVDSAVVAAKGSQLVLQEAVKESAIRWAQKAKSAK